MFFTLADILTRRAVFHIERNTDSSRVTARVTKEREKEERPTVTFSLAGRKSLTAVITAVILAGLMMIYIFLRIIRVKKARKKR